MSPGARGLRVVLVDDDQFSREGLRGMFESDGGEVVGEAASLVEALATLGAATPDVVVIDPKVPGGRTAEAMPAIAEAAPQARVAVLTDSGDEHDVLAAFAAGATSYLLKAAPAEELLTAIRQTAAGSTVLAQAVAQGLLSALAARARSTRAGARANTALSARELEVLTMIVDGADNAEIGRVLSISRHTVKQHVTNIFDKLGVRTRVEAAVLAVREGLL